MSKHAPGEQRQIAAWFNSVYRRKGERYLRPVEAYEIFVGLLAPAPGSRLLDIACGIGHMLKAAGAEGCELYGVDIADVAVRAASKNVAGARLAVANAERLPFADGSFDAVTCLGSLERMLDRRAALAEMQRVSRARARFCFLVRNAETFSFRYLTGGAKSRRSRGHQAAGSLDYWRDLFESTGFRILQTLPDQFPLQRRARWLQPGNKPFDYRQPLESRRPLERANEFIFLLEKAA